MATQLLERMTIDQGNDDERKLFAKGDVCECAGEDGSNRGCPFASVCRVLASLTIGDHES